MFPLKDRKLIRGFQAHINAGLGGAADYKANYVPFVIPFDGKVETYWGDEGGNWLRLIRDNGDRIELAHLSKYAIKSGQAKEGQPGGITGNTGSITDYPHLHIQILNNKGQRLDPETYNWTTQIPMTTIKATVVINGGLWASLPPKLQTINDWYKLNSGDKLNLSFTAKGSNFSSIPFKVLPDGSAVIDEQWFDANVLDPQAHTTILVIRDQDLSDNYPGGFKLVARTSGYMGKVPTKTVVACGENDMSEIYPSLNAFVDYTEHELMHSCYHFSGSANPPPYGSGLDQTHKYFYDLKNREGAFSELNYQNINNLLKGTSMALFKKTLNLDNEIGVFVSVDKAANLGELNSVFGTSLIQNPDGSIATQVKARKI